nr:hypothetical protein OH837_48810 [Streptomyces canus]
MDLDTALANATDAVTGLVQTIHDDGNHSAEAHGARLAVLTAFVTARTLGATDADLRTTHNFA